MACFIVPTAEAIAVTAIKHFAPESSDSVFIKKIDWLSKMLWGGSALLCAEHIWHGEVTAIPPFLTALESAEETVVMLKEMATVGVSMAVLTTLVWVGMVAIYSVHQKKKVRLVEE